MIPAGIAARPLQRGVNGEDRADWWGHGVSGTGANGGDARANGAGRGVGWGEVGPLAVSQAGERAGVWLAGLRGEGLRRVGSSWAGRTGPRGKWAGERVGPAGWAGLGKKRFGLGLGFLGCYGFGFWVFLSNFYFSPF